MSDQPAAAWHVDPTGRHEYRWWDGTQWTSHVSDRGLASIEPIVPPPPWSPTLPVPPRRRTWLWLIAAIGTVLGIVGAIV